MLEIIQIIIIVIVSLICLAAYFGLLRVMFPRRLTVMKELIEKSTIRTLLIGFVNALFIGALILVFAALMQWTTWQIFNLPLLLCLGFLLFGISVGLGGFVELVGERLSPASSIIVQTIWGTAVSGLACALPFIGWFILSVYVCLLGFGAFILGLFSRHNES